ncbi:hypothetical protein X801_06921, partial [Opisthorchis viverrini]
DSKSIAFALERRLELPKRELQRFNGNSKDYWTFMKAFSSTIEDCTRDDEARLDGDSSALSDLAQQLAVCEVTSTEMVYSSHLNSQHTFQTIVRGLPSLLRFKWAKAVANIRREDRD